MKISISTKARLNGVGIAGVMLLVGSPLLAGLIYVASVKRAVDAARYGIPANFSGDMWIAMLCGVTTILGMVMLFLGREYDHTVTIDSPANPAAHQVGSSPVPRP